MPSSLHTHGILKAESSVITSTACYYRRASMFQSSVAIRSFLAVVSDPPCDRGRTLLPEVSVLSF